MEIDKKAKAFNVTSSEPFGRLLVELMQNNSYEDEINKTLRKVGEILISSYLENEIDSVNEFGLNTDRRVLYKDIAKDMATKAEVHARNTEIAMRFPEEFFEGLARIAIREIKELPGLYSEREIVQIAVDKCITNAYGEFYDDQDLELIDEEIQQAEASREFMDLLRKYRKRKYRN